MFSKNELNYVQSSANWKVVKKLADLKTFSEVIMGLSVAFFFVGLGIGTAVGIEKNPRWASFLSIFIYTFLFFGFIRLSLFWTLNHKEAAKAFLKIFGATSVITLFLFVVISVPAVLTTQPLADIPVTALGILFSFLLVSLVFALVLIYLMTWGLFGTTVALGSAFVWTTSKSASFLMRRYNQNTLIYVATFARILNFALPLLSFVVGLLLYWMGLVNLPFVR